MTVLIWIIIGLLVIIGALSYACFNLIKKIEIYEDWVNRFKSESDSLYQRLKIVDDKNLFEKDDDVGFVFSEVLRITKEFNETVK
jgi:hypothetical protein